MENKQAIAKGVISAVASFLVAEVSQRKINQMREKAGIPKIHHYQVGTTALSAGALNAKHKLAPYAIGGGSGLIIHDVVDVFRDISRAYQPLPHPFSKYELGEGDIEVYRYEVSDTNLKARYNKIAEILQFWTKKQADDPKVMAWAREVVRKDDSITNARDPIQCGKALAYWINGYPGRRRGIKFVKDPKKRSFDSFQTATRTLKWRTGDCDCMSILFGTGMHSLGHPNGYYLISQNPIRPKNYGHILPTIIKDGNWIPAELTHSRPVGYMPPFFKRGRILVD